MFNSLVADTAAPNELAQRLTYFSKVRLSLSGSRFFLLCSRVGLSPLISLIDSGDLAITIETRGIGTKALTPDPNGPFEFVLKRYEDKPSYTYIEEFRSEFLCNWYELKGQWTEAEHLLDRCSYIPNASLNGHLAIAALSDHQLTTQTFLRLWHATPWTRRKKVRGTYLAFHPRDDYGLSWDVESDFGWPKFFPSTVWQDNLSAPQSVALALLLCRNDVDLFADGSAELWLGHLKSCALEASYECIFSRSIKSMEQIQIFEQIALKKVMFGDELWNLDGFANFIEFLQNPETQNWKRWLRQQRVSRELITEYHRAIFGGNRRTGAPKGKLAWFTANIASGLAIDAAMGGASLPFKIAAAVATAGVMAGGETAASAALKGWSPTHWVDGPVRQLSWQKLSAESRSDGFES